MPEVVHIEEDSRVRQDLPHPLLDDSHLVLAGAPHMREEKVELLTDWLRGNEFLLALMLPHEATLPQPIEALGEDGVHKHADREEQHDQR